MQTVAKEIRNAINRVRSALASTSLIAYQSHYLVKDGRVHAQNGSVYASAVCPVDGTFVVSGKEFERAVDKLPTDKLTIGFDQSSGLVSVRGGRFRSTIQTLPIDDFNIDVEAKEPVPFDGEKLIYALGELHPFVDGSSTRPFVTCYQFNGGEVFATTGLVVAMCEESGFPHDVSFQLPKGSADFFLSMTDEKITDIALETTRMTVEWEDGTRMTTCLGNTEWPASGMDMARKAPPCEYEISKEWRESVMAMSEFGEKEIFIHADKVTVGRGRSKTELEIETPAPETGHSCWTLETVLPVLEKATHADFTLWPKPMAFRWDKIRGIVAARQ